MKNIVTRILNRIGLIRKTTQRNNASISSLGVMEHWNNAKEKKYSRNLGKKEGIELVQKSIPVN